MIAFIKGTLYKKTNTSVILETGGIGYNINVSLNTLSSIGQSGDAVLLHTYMKTAEDGVTLYGFLSENELRMFNYLIGVNGIGPKNALAVLSYLTPETIITAVLSEDVQTLSKAQGIGKKTAARIIIDLKDKFRSDSLLPAGITPQQTLELANTSVNEAIDALMALGYSQSDSTKAVIAVSEDGLDSGAIIKLALKRLVRN